MGSKSKPTEPVMGRLREWFDRLLRREADEPAADCFSVESQITREELRELRERQRQMDRREIERFESEGGAMFVDAFRFPSAEALLALRAERELAKKDR